MAQFIIPGEPKGKARARTFYNPKLKRMQSITPEQTVLYENLIKQCYLETGETGYFDKQPVAMCIRAHFQIPKSVSKKKEFYMAMGKIRPTKKPDVDNIAKVVCDALNGIAYGDDSQIVWLEVVKYWTAEEPRVEVDVWAQEE